MSLRLLSAIVCLVFASCGSQLGEPIRIGAIIPLTGPEKEHATITNGMVFAADEINDLGGVGGRKIVIVTVAAAQGTDSAEKAFIGIEADAAPVAYVTASSGMSLKLAPLAGRNEVPLIGILTATSDFSRQNEWCFRYWISSEMAVAPVLKIITHLDVGTLAVLYQDDELGRSVLEALRPAAEARGVKVETAAFGMQEKDLSPAVSMLPKSDAIYLVGSSSSIQQALRAVRRLEYGGHVIVFVAGTDPAVRATPDAEGVYALSSRIYDRNYPFARDVSEKYEKRFRMEFDHRAASGYDVVRLVAELLEKTDADRHSLRKSLAGGFIYPGLFGDLDIGPGERDFLLPMAAARVAGGEVIFLE